VSSYRNATLSRDKNARLKRMYSELALENAAIKDLLQRKP